MTKANESRRNDPVINGAVRSVLAERLVVVSEVSVLAEQARAAIDARPYPHSNDDVFIDRIVSAVFNLQREIEQYGKLNKDDVNQTYIGNKSAFVLGELIAKDLERAKEKNKGE